MSTYTMKRGDSAQDLLYRLRGYDDAGALVYQSLAGVTSVTLHLRRAGVVDSIEAAAVELTPDEWWVRVDGEELAELEEGRHEWETEVLFADGTRQTYPNGAGGARTSYDTLLVVADLAGAAAP